MLNQAFFGCQLEYIINLEEPEALNVDGTTFLISLVVEMGVHSLDLIILLKVEDLYICIIR